MANVNIRSWDSIIHQNVCLLTEGDNTSICMYAYALGAVSIIFTFAIGLLQVGRAAGAARAGRGHGAVVGLWANLVRGDISSVGLVADPSSQTRCLLRTLADMHLQHVRLRRRDGHGVCDHGCGLVGRGRPRHLHGEAGRPLGRGSWVGPSVWNGGGGRLWRLASTCCHLRAAACPPSQAVVPVPRRGAGVARWPADRSCPPAFPHPFSSATRTPQRPTMRTYPRASGARRWRG